MRFFLNTSENAISRSPHFVWERSEVVVCKLERWGQLRPGELACARLPQPTVSCQLEGTWLPSRQISLCFRESSEIIGSSNQLGGSKKDPYPAPNCRSLSAIKGIFAYLWSIRFQILFGLVHRFWVCKALFLHFFIVRLSDAFRH